jgi:undecaprenyl-diphosphatase
VAAAAAACVATALGARYAGEAYPRWIDNLALVLARDWFSNLRGPARDIIGLFDPVPLVVLIAVLAGVCLVLGRRRLAVLAVAGPVLTGVATTALKPLIERTKDGDLAYPSGHMGAAVALAVVVGLLLASMMRARRGVRIAVAAAIPIVVGTGMGLAVTVTDYHYLTDAVGGFCVSIAVVLSLAAVLDRWPRRRPEGVRRVGGAGNAPHAVSD